MLSLPTSAAVDVYNRSSGNQDTVSANYFFLLSCTNSLVLLHFLVNEIYPPCEVSQIGTQIRIPTTIFQLMDQEKTRKVLYRNSDMRAVDGFRQTTGDLQKYLCSVEYFRGRT